MRFKEIMDEVKGVEFNVVRVEGPYYFEAVILRDGLPALAGKLKKFFGDQAYSSDKRFTPDEESAVEGFGGIREGQTLYFLKEKGHFYFAMLWPWSDEYHITVKLGWK